MALIAVRRPAVILAGRIDWAFSFVPSGLGSIEKLFTEKLYIDNVTEDTWTL